MTNEEAAKACNEIYNGFWNKWKRRRLGRHSSEWEQIHSEAIMLLERHPFPMAEHMINDFMDELEGRVRRAEKQNNNYDMRQTDAGSVSLLEEECR